MSVLDALPLPWYMMVGLSLFLLIPLAALALARGNEAVEGAPRGVGVFVLLAGPPGAGKTALQMRLCRGVALPPVLLQPSASESRLRLRLRQRGDAVRATTLDVPGAPPFRTRALEVAALAQCACVVLVVDAAAPAAGGHFAQAAELLAALLAARAPPPPLLVKIAPDLTDGELRDIVAAARAARVDGLVVSNTTVARPPGLRSGHAAEAGGLSGAPLRAPATAALRKAYEAAAGALPLVGVGGVASADDAYEKIRNGASLVQLYSALAYHGPTLVADIKAGLAQRLRDDGFACVEDAVGVDTDVRRGKKGKL